MKVRFVERNESFAFRRRKELKWILFKIFLAFKDFGELELLRQGLHFRLNYKICI